MWSGELVALTHPDGKEQGGRIETSTYHRWAWLKTKRVGGVGRRCAPADDLEGGDGDVVQRKDGGYVHQEDGRTNRKKEVMRSSRRRHSHKVENRGTAAA